MKYLFKGLKILFVLGLVGIACLALLTLWYAKDLPNPESILSKGFAESTKIYDRTGKILLYQVGEERRTVVKLDQLPNHVKQATLAAEDADFYKHPGIDITSILRAAWTDVTQQTTVGGSTITQQFVKNALLTREKTFSRKFRELLLSFWLELKYSKDQIFAFYINQIPYGGNAYGIQQASTTYFGKSVGDLTAAEAAVLAALPQRPSYLSPYGEHVDELMARKDWVLDQMVEAKFITKEKADEAKGQAIAFAPANNSFIAPHFVIYVKEYLEQKYGSELLEKGGLEVITSLDVRIQQEAEAAVAETVAKNEKRYNAGNAALVALDPKTGQILSMVGSRDWFDDTHDGKVNVTLRLRQPGSSFKPYAYARLFQDGFGPESLVFDLQTTFRTRAGQAYTPRNYDGRFHGLLTIRQALAGSRNVAAVKALHLTGINNVIELVRQMGITTIDPSRVDLALVLGGSEVRLLDHTAAYAVFANDGEYNQPQAILRVKKSDGEVLEEYKEQSRQVLSPEITRLITSILSDNVARAAVFGPSSPLTTSGIPSAAKTGTTTDFRDGWTMGYTPNLVVGVWAGNNDNSPTKNGEGAFIAGPIWNRIIRFAAGKYPKEFGGAFPASLPHKLLEKPMANGQLAYNNTVLIDSSTGLPATDDTPPSLIQERIYKEVHSELYYIRPKDPQLGAWEAPIAAWITTQPDGYLYNQTQPIPSEDTTPLAQKPELTITNIADNEEVGSSITIAFTFTSATALKQADIFIDDTLVKSVVASPTTVDLSLFTNGAHTVRVRAFDQTLKFSEKEIPIIINKVSGGISD